MIGQLNQFTWADWERILKDIGRYLLRKWLLLLVAAAAAAMAALILRPTAKPVYSATYTFVLSTETRPQGISAGLASQLGLDIGSNGADNIFYGENILELFKSRKLESLALMRTIDGTSTTLLNLMAKKLFATEMNGIPPFPDSIEAFSAVQKRVFEKVVKYVDQSFDVYKKDKRLIFYVITASSSDPEIAFLTAKHMLTQTAGFFIETKTKTARKSLELLQKEADSLTSLLSGLFQNTAALNDRSFNINPSILVQRSGMQLNQSRSVAIAAAYTEVMRNLEVAKINIQKETPLYQVIDEPVLPLENQYRKSSKMVYVAGLLGLICMAVFLAVQQFLRSARQIKST